MASAICAAVGAMFVWSGVFTDLPNSAHDIALKLGCAFTAFACATWPRPLFEPHTWHVVFRGMGPPSLLGGVLSLVGIGCFLCAVALWVLGAVAA